MIELAKQLLDVDDDIKQREAELKELKAQRDTLNERLTQEMVDEEMQSLNVRGKLLYLNTTIQASYKKEIQDQFFDILRGHGYGAIIKPNINANTLKATVRELIEENSGELPEWLDGMVNVFQQTKVNIKKS